MCKACLEMFIFFYIKKKKIIMLELFFYSSFILIRKLKIQNGKYCLRTKNIKCSTGNGQQKTESMDLILESVN